MVDFLSRHVISLEAHLCHVLVVCVPVAQRTLCQDCHVRQDVEDCHPRPHVCGGAQVTSAEKHTLKGGRGEGKLRVLLSFAEGKLYQALVNPLLR